MGCIASSFLRGNYFIFEAWSCASFINDSSQQPSIGVCGYITCQLDTFFSNPLSHFNITGCWIVRVASPSFFNSPIVYHLEFLAQFHSFWTLCFPFDLSSLDHSTNNVIRSTSRVLRNAMVYDSLLDPSHPSCLPLRARGSCNCRRDA